MRYCTLKDTYSPTAIEKRLNFALRKRERFLDVMIHKLNLLKNTIMECVYRTAEIVKKVSFVVLVAEVLILFAMGF